MHWLLVVIALSGPVLPPVVSFSTAAFVTEAECEGAKRAVMEAVAESPSEPHGRLEVVCKPIDPKPADLARPAPTHFKLEHNT